MRRPRNMAIKSIAPGLVLTLLLIGLLTLFAYRLGMYIYPGSLMHARTLAFAVLSLTQLFHAFNERHRMRSVFGIGLFSNLFLIGSVLFGIALQASVITVRPFAAVFRVAALSMKDWLFVAAVAFFPILFNEIVKIGRRKRQGTHSHRIR